MAIRLWIAVDTLYRSTSATKKHAANINLFKKPSQVNTSFFEVELKNAQVEHKESIIVRFFILQYAKLRILELYYNFFTKLCGVNKFEKLERTHIRCILLLPRKNRKIVSELKWERKGSGYDQITVSVVLLPMLKQFFSVEHVL